METAGLIVAGLVALTVGAELLVRGASRLAVAVGVSPLVIGLTVVAYGTSAPEFAVNVKAGLAGQSDIGMGNVVGSNIFNILLILGVSALIRPLWVNQQLIRQDVPIMIAVSGLGWLLALNGSLGRFEGIVLCAGIVLYTGFLMVQARRTNVAHPPPGVAAPSPPRGEGGGEGRGHSARHGSNPHPALSLEGRGFPRAGAPQSEEAAAEGAWWRRLGRWSAPAAGALVAGGLALLAVGAGWLVRGAVDLAAALGVSELVIALTIVAAGTSLPEAATSVVATIHGKRDIAIGNIVGSNIFNLLAVLGAGTMVSRAGVTVAPAALGLDIPVMVAAAVMCLPVFFTGRRIARWEGGLFLAYYGAYLACLISRAAGHASFPSARSAMLWGLTPLFLVVVLLPMARLGRARAGAGSG